MFKRQPPSSYSLFRANCNYKPFLLYQLSIIILSNSFPYNTQWLEDGGIYMCDVQIKKKEV